MEREDVIGITQLNDNGKIYHNGEILSGGTSVTLGSGMTITSREGFSLEKWISHLGNTGGDFYSNLGGMGVNQSSPFFRPDIDKVVDTEGFFGGILNSLGIGNFDRNWEFGDILTELMQKGVELDDSVPGIIGEQKNKSFYGTIFTGTELTTNPEGQANGVRMTGETRYIDNLTGSQVDSIKSRNRSDSLKYIRQTIQRSDSFLNQMLKRK